MLNSISTYPKTRASFGSSFQVPARFNREEMQGKLTDITQDDDRLEEASICWDNRKFGFKVTVPDKFNALLEERLQDMNINYIPSSKLKRPSSSCWSNQVPIVREKTILDYDS